MIQGDETIVYSDNYTLYVRRNEQCCGVYCHYDDTSYINPSQYQPYHWKRTELATFHDEQPNDDTLEHIGHLTMHIYKKGIEDGKKLKVEEIKSCLQN